MKSDFEAFEVLSILEGIKGLEFGNIKEETVEVGVSHVTGRESSVPSLEPGQYVLKGHSERLIDTPFSLGKEIQPGHSEGDQPWNFFGRNDAKAEAPVLWPPDAKS